MVNSATGGWSEKSRPQVKPRRLPRCLTFATRRAPARFFYVFLLARFAGYPLIRGESHDFLNKKQHNKNTNRKDSEVMAKAMSKSQLAAAIAEKAEIPKKQATEILEHIADLAYKHAKDTFTLPGIGKLVLKNRAARMGRNPKTGEQIQIPAKRVVKFRVAKAAKDAILGAK
jgi:DNA-binding protein HU-beta